MHFRDFMLGWIGAYAFENLLTGRFALAALDLLGILMILVLSSALGEQ